MTRRIPITFEIEPRAVPFEVARKALGMSRTTFWKERSLGNIKTVPYNRVPVSEIDRYSSEEARKNGVGTRLINLATAPSASASATGNPSNTRT